MYRHYLFICMVLISLPGILCNAGSISLGERTFDKVVRKFPAVLVKFDVAFPYGEKYDTFKTLSQETSKISDLLLAEVGIKDYGERENEVLAQRFNVKKEDFPVLKLFLQNTEKPIDFPATTPFTLENLKKFVRDNSNIYIGLPGCLEQFDRLAKQFSLSNEEGKASWLTLAEKDYERLNKEDQHSANVYITVMKKVIAQGNKFKKTEEKRIQNILKGKLSSKKQVELQERLNILKAFEFKVESKQEL